MNAASHPNRDSNALAQLDAEWSVIADRAIAAALKRWQRKHPVLRRFSDPRHLIHSLHTTGARHTDEPLLALLELASQDRLAGRVVLQAFLPALKKLSQRIGSPGERSDEIWEFLFLSAWETICAYPTATRRRRVAANLYLGILGATVRAVNAPDGTARRERRRSFIPTADAQALVFAAADSGMITHQDAELIVRTRFHREALVWIAAEDGVSYTALRMRRIRAEQRLRDHLVETGVVTFSGVLGPTSIEGQFRDRPTAPHTSPDAAVCRKAA